MEMGRMERLEQVVTSDSKYSWNSKPNNYLLWACCLLILGCKKVDLAPEAKNNKSILVYISANNDLKYSALRSIDQMEKSYRKEDGDLIVFIKTERYSSHILKIKQDETQGVIASDTLKTYGNENSSSVDFMEKVFKDMKSFSLAREYGLILWSHATSWIPEAKGTPQLKSFGYDRGKALDLKDLKAALPDNLKFILFDACYMASVEVVYELRKKADYIIASSSEVLNTSYPYDLILRDLFAEDLISVCSKFYKYYNSKNGIDQSATVSLIKTKSLEKLGLETKLLLERSDKRKINILSRNSQNFNFVKDISIGFYDFMSLIKDNYKENEYAEIKKALVNCILYKAYTKTFLNLPVLESSGLTLSLIDMPFLLNYYKSLDWYLDAGLQNIYE